jgi:ribulose-5-phosphate 4-epimerase/fuculose-1-phosphate aldolase
MTVFEEMCRKVASLKLVQASSGNLSRRSFTKEQEFFITSTGCWFENITADDVVKCSLKTKKKVNKSDKNPSSETLMHALILQNRPDVCVVLHYQPVYGTLISCSSYFPDFNIIPEIPYCIGDVSCVDYYKPGSRELAKNVSQALSTANLVIMQNHGLTVVGKDFEQVLQRAIFFELACEIIVKSQKSLNRIF